MSRIGKNPIDLPDGVSVRVEGARVLAKGSKGELSSPLPKGIELSEEDSRVRLVCDGNNSTDLGAMYGTVRALLANNIRGVSQGWDITLELVGVGYRAQVKGQNLSLSLGYSHNIHYSLADGIVATVKDQTKINLSSIDKQKLGQAAAEIRSMRPPEPYKGKGVRYSDEHIIRKAGKSAKAAKK